MFKRRFDSMRDTMGFRRFTGMGRKAVSPVISTLLMVNIVFAAGILYFIWSQGALTKSYSVIQLMYRSDIDRSKEALVVEDARFLDRTDYPDTQFELNVTIRSIGAIDSRIVALYFNTTEFLGDVDSYIIGGGTVFPPEPDGTYPILFHDKITFRFENSTVPLNNGDIVDVIFVTERGTRAIAEWEVSP